MKKSLLLSVVAMFAATGFAQNAPSIMDVKVKNPLQNSLKLYSASDMEAQVSKVSKAPARSITSGTYFTRPTGAYYVGYTMQGMGYPYSILTTPMNKGLVFKNMSQNAYFRDGYGRALTEAGGDYTFSTNLGISDICPILIHERDSFCLGTNNIYAMGLADGDSRFTPYKNFEYLLNWGLVGPNSANVLYAVDDHSGEYYNNELYNNVASLSSSTDSYYLFGSGNMIDKSGNKRGTVSAISQYFGTTAGALTINEVVMQGFSKSQPIPAGKVLTAYITNAVEDAFSDGTPMIQAGDQIYAVLTCEPSDTVDFSEKQAVGEYFNASQGFLRFTKKVKDEFGNMSSEPVILPENTKFCIQIAGLDQDGIDFGGFGLNTPAEDNDPLYTGIIYYKKVDNPDEMAITAYSNKEGILATKIGFVGLYDGVDAPIQPGMYSFESKDLFYNVVRVTGTGDATETLTDGARGNVFAQNPVDGADGFPCAPFYTVNPFFDDDDAANYEVECPDWLSWEVANLYQNQKGENTLQFYGMVFKAQALPAGMTGRQGEVKIIGKGVETTIFVLQGDATLDVNNAVADKNVKKSGKMFNIAGQEVDKNFKGIVVKDGKKFLNK